ncbi:hypothetical protein BTVI_119242 [Pitangus sulphuratus]|nr:hypothetical protein BTVI_119242 [Pitangus sulphuratus]
MATPPSKEKKPSVSGVDSTAQLEVFGPSPCYPMEVASGTDIQPAAHDGPYARAGGCTQRICDLMESMLEQFMKNCSLWKGPMLDKFVENCLLWLGPHTGAEKEHEEEEAAEKMFDSN